MDPAAVTPCSRAGLPAGTARPKRLVSTTMEFAFRTVSQVPDRVPSYGSGGYRNCSDSFGVLDYSLASLVETQAGPGDACHPHRAQPMRTLSTQLPAHLHSAPQSLTLALLGRTVLCRWTLAGRLG